MARTRISTTVDEQRLAEARRRLSVSDSQLVDRALDALLHQLETERERAALTESPYEADPALAWRAPAGPDLPYDGDIPAEVQALATQRRRQARA
jgi:hypothetical protein